MGTVYEDPQSGSTLEVEPGSAEDALVNKGWTQAGNQKKSSEVKEAKAQPSVSSGGSGAVAPNASDAGLATPEANTEVSGQDDASVQDNRDKAKK